LNNSAAPNGWVGKTVDVPNGHEIIGVAIQTNAQGYITWLDLMTWKPPRF
jgi:hypothetical protein